MLECRRAAIGGLQTDRCGALGALRHGEWSHLGELDPRAELDHELWSPHEIAHLRFLRWLAKMGRLVEDGGPAAVSDGARAMGR